MLGDEKGEDNLLENHEIGWCVFVSHDFTVSRGVCVHARTHT